MNEATITVQGLIVTILVACFVAFVGCATTCATVDVARKGCAIVQYYDTQGELRRVQLTNGDMQIIVSTLKAEAK